MKSPFERFHESLEELSPEALARIDARADPAALEAQEVGWKADPDPLHLNWNWRPRGLDEPPLACPPELRELQSRRARLVRSRTWLSALAAALLLAVGVGLGGYFFRGGSGEQAIVAQAGVRMERGIRGGDQLIPRLEISSNQAGFLTVVVLDSQRPTRPEVLPIAPAADIPVPAGPQATSLLLPEHLATARGALVIVTRTPAADTLDKQLSSQKFAAGQWDELEAAVRAILTGRGYDALDFVRIDIPQPAGQP